MINTFTGWIEGFLTQTKKAEEMLKQTNKQTNKKLLHEIIMGFGLPRSLQSGNATSLTSKVTQGISKALGITYYLHCAWRSRSSGKVESQPILKFRNKKDNPGEISGMEGDFTNRSPPNPYFP